MPGLLFGLEGFQLAGNDFLFRLHLLLPGLGRFQCFENILVSLFSFP